ncbi:MAG TPA: molybdate ABC transporter substrate-binding protein [Actinomycetales bacterium]|nr:molybdate ABC transporter substrate-binding protein [Actinomycetales bacterium]
MVGHLVAVVTAAGLLAACASGPTSGAAGRTDGSQLSGRVTVLAAASLSGVFDELAKTFEAQHRGVDVVVSYGGSSGLAQQVLAGVPADVFAAASTTTMRTVADAGATAGQPVVFARNELDIAVPPGNPGHVRGLADLGDPKRKVALCAEQVPCGAAATQLFRAAGVKPAPDTLEQDVKAVLSKVRLGEVDAGLVYRTDVRAAGDSVEGISVPQANEAVNDYEITVLKGAPNQTAARSFVDLVVSAQGRSGLQSAGFLEP